MKVFISWSGESSRRFAAVLKKWLPQALQAVEVYYSPGDITKGTRWSTEIAKELEAARVGLICLTRDNLNAPWIMFEAGALSKSVDKSRVCPILFGVDPTDIEGPLVEFQAAKFEKPDIKEVVKMINDELGQLGELTLTPEELDRAFGLVWPGLEEDVQGVSGELTEAQPPAVRSDRDLLGEILELTRSLARGSTPLSLLDPLAVSNVVDVYQKLIVEAANLGARGLCELLWEMQGTLVSMVGIAGDDDLKLRFLRIANQLAGVKEALSEEEEIPF